MRLREVSSRFGRRKDVRCRADGSRRTSRGNRRGSDENAARIEAHAPERGAFVKIRGETREYASDGRD